MGFDLAFGGYSDVPLRMGKVVAERQIASREIDPATGAVGKYHCLLSYLYSIVMKSEIIDLEIEKCNENNFKYDDY